MIILKILKKGHKQYNEATLFPSTRWDMGDRYQ